MVKYYVIFVISIKFKELIRELCFVVFDEIVVYKWCVIK